MSASTFSDSPVQNAIAQTAIVLAGERPGGNALAQAHASPSSLTIDLNGRPVIDWTLDAVQRSSIERVILVGPGDGAANHPCVAGWRDHPDFESIEPAAGPAASALKAAEAAAEWPLLLTAADHALLKPVLIDQFCAQAQLTAEARNADLVVGLIDYRHVYERFPDSKRTQLKFSDSACCGTNLFYLSTPNATRALRVWSEFEALRKTPWKIAKRLGLRVCIRYLRGKLSAEAAFSALSERTGARLTYCKLVEAELAVDVDTVADLELAAKVLRDRELMGNFDREPYVD